MHGMAAEVSELLTCGPEIGDRPAGVRGPEFEVAAAEADGLAQPPLCPHEEVKDPTEL